MTDTVLRDHLPAIKRLRFENKWSLQRIAQKYGVSRERVRQLIPNTAYVRAERTAKVHAAIREETDKTNTELASEFGLSSVYVANLRGDIRHAVEPGGNVETGYQMEEYASQVLASNGISNELMPIKHPFDINASGCRIDVKSANPLATPTSPVKTSQYKFQVQPGDKRDDADFYVCITIDTLDIFVIPTSVVSRNSQFIYMTWPLTHPTRGRYQKYHNRLNLIKRFIKEHNS